MDSERNFFLFRLFLTLVLISSIFFMLFVIVQIVPPQRFLQMNRINEFGIEPGVYLDEQGNRYVVSDIITHLWLVPLDNSSGQMTPMSNPLVVLHELQSVSSMHRSEAYPLDEFRKRFTPEK